MKQQFTKSFQHLSAITLIAFLSFTTSTVLGQQVIGSFPSMDGGFEAQAASGTALAGASIASGVQRPDWTCGTSSYGSVKSASPRTGSKYIAINLTGGTKRIQSATAGANAMQTYALLSTGTTTTGSMDIAVTASTANVVVGMSVIGGGIPTGTTVTAVGANTVTVSAAATAAATVNIAVFTPATYTVQYYYRTTGTTNVGGQTQYIGASADGTNPLPSMGYTVLGNIGKGTTASGSSIITAYVASAPTALAVGTLIAGAGIPAGTTVTAFDATTITMSANATVAGTGVILSTTPLAGTNNAWAKLTCPVTVSPSTNPAPQYGYVCVARTTLLMATGMDIDDVAVYAGALDETAPDAVTSPSAPTTSPTQMVVSWTAPSTGVDGGGYMVVRSAVADPTAVPNVNGIYSLGSTVSDGAGVSGTVVYLGTNPTFTDAGLTAVTAYNYRIYTVDKAFNYSAAASVTGTTDVSTSVSQTTIKGVTFDGITIQNVAGLDLKVFDTTGRLVVSSNKNITMSSNSKGIYFVKSNSGVLKIVL